MGEFEELRRVGTKHSRAAELELEKKKQELEHDEGQRKKQEEAYRKRKAAENQKLLRDELERKRHEEEQRRREAAALLRAKERAREREREKEVEERVRKQKATSNGPSYSRSKAGLSSTSSSVSSRGYEPAKPAKKEFSFDYIQKLAQSKEVDRVSKKSNGSDGPARSGERPSSVPLNRQEAIDRHKVRTISPERTLAPASIAGPNFMKKTAIARRQAAPRSAFPVFRSAGASVNHIRDAGLKALRDGPIALNTVKRDRRSYEEISADVNDKSSRLEERERRIKAIEEEREKARLHRERVLQGARFSKALLGDNAAETERLQREIKSGSSKSSRDRSRSRSRSMSPSRRKRSKSPGRRKSLSPRPSKKRSYSPETRKRSISPHARRKRSFSPPTARKKISKEQDDRDRDRGRGRGRDQDYNRESGTRAIKRPTNGSTKRRPSRSPSPRSSGHRRASPPRNAGKGRGQNDNDMSLHNVLGSLFGTRYRSRADDEDLSDDMEARPDEVFREEARSARLGRLEDEKEAELEKAQMARKRKLAKEKERGRS